MSGERKIIGMWRSGRNDETSHAADNVDEGTVHDDESPLRESRDSVNNHDVNNEEVEESWSHYGDEEPAESSAKQMLAPALLLGAIMLWTGFLAWVNRDIFATGLAPKELLSLIESWCLPVATLVLVYILYQRSSTKEVRKFGDAAQVLRLESENLEGRLKNINSELSIAREFLASESLELESLGRTSADNIAESAQKIKTSLNEGLKDVRNLDEVGSNASKNLEQLKEHLPVVINLAKDVTNQIGAAGRTAHGEVEIMTAALAKIENMAISAKNALADVSHQSDKSFETLVTGTKAIHKEFHTHVNTAKSSANETSYLLKKAAQKAKDTMETASGAMLASMDEANQAMEQQSSSSADILKAELKNLQKTISVVGQSTSEEEERLRALVHEMNESIASISEKIADLDNDSGEKTARLAFAMTALDENSEKLITSMKDGFDTAEGMKQKAEEMLLALDSGARELDETLPTALNRLDDKANASLDLIKSISSEAHSIEEATTKFTDSLDNVTNATKGKREELEKFGTSGKRTVEDLSERLEALTQLLSQVRENSDDIATGSSEKLVASLLRVKETANQASLHSKEALERSLEDSASNFEKLSEELMERVVNDRIGAIGPMLEAAVAKAVSSTQVGADHLRTQLKAIEETTENLEQRILFAKEKAEQSSDENFARRVALLTESLNSTAIDVTKLLDSDVGDTEWAAYLKGDRGVFSRRAVRLLDAADVKEVLTEYDNNMDFREHVNRYIHDFETMLRAVLSTRDGSAVSVTLLSSDVGKLYVALAQAIERLRH